MKYPPPTTLSIDIQHKSPCPSCSTCFSWRRTLTLSWISGVPRWRRGRGEASGLRFGLPMGAELAYRMTHTESAMTPKPQKRERRSSLSTVP